MRLRGDWAPATRDRWFVRLRRLLSILVIGNKAGSSRNGGSALAVLAFYKAARGHACAQPSLWVPQCHLTGETNLAEGSEECATCPAGLWCKKLHALLPKWWVASFFSIGQRISVKNLSRRERPKIYKPRSVKTCR